MKCHDCVDVPPCTFCYFRTCECSHRYKISSFNISIDSTRSRPEILALKHETVVQPCILFKEEPSHGPTSTESNLFYHGCHECPIILLFCFRARNSGPDVRLQTLFLPSSHISHSHLMPGPRPPPPGRYIVLEV